MLRLLTIVVFLVNTIITQAQWDSTHSAQPALQKITFLELGFQHVGINFQRVAGKRLVVDLAAGLGSSYDVYEGGIESNWNLFAPAAHFAITPRMYYNRERRARKGKTTALNAGNYVGVRLRYATAKITGDGEAALLTNIHWGLQRPLGKRWIFNTHVGAGWAAQLGDNWNTIYPSLDLKFSYALFNRQLNRQ